MKEIQLTKGYVAQVDDKDYAKVSQYKWCAMITRCSVYARCSFPSINGKQPHVLLHRFILGVTDPQTKVDHEDHNGLNNQRFNLRKATQADNNHNIRICKNNTSGFKGVSWITFRSGNGKWKAEITAYGKRKHLGLFTSKQEAAIAYDKAAVKYHGAFACTNAMLQEAA